MMHFIVSASEKAMVRAAHYAHFNTHSPDEASVFVVFGGDGFMLETIRMFAHYGKPFYGVNCGHVGFLMNDGFDCLKKGIEESKKSILHPLIFESTDVHGLSQKSFAINEVALMRHGPLASSIDILINHQKRMTSKGDGILVSTPAGSTAYNASAGGAILPLSAHLLALTPLCVYHPKHWKGALLNADAHVIFKVNHPLDRPVDLTYDNKMIQNIDTVHIYQDKSIGFELLFDSKTTLEERILKEQFLMNES